MIVVPYGDPLELISRRGRERNEAFEFAPKSVRRPDRHGPCRSTAIGRPGLYRIDELPCRADLVSGDSWAPAIRRHRAEMPTGSQLGNSVPGNQGDDGRTGNRDPGRNRSRGTAQRPTVRLRTEVGLGQLGQPTAWLKFSLPAPDSTRMTFGGWACIRRCFCGKTSFPPGWRARERAGRSTECAAARQGDDPIDERDAA